MGGGEGAEVSVVASTALCQYDFKECFTRDNRRDVPKCRLPATHVGIEIELEHCDDVYLCSKHAAAVAHWLREEDLDPEDHLSKLGEVSR